MYPSYASTWKVLDLLMTTLVAASNIGVRRVLLFSRTLLFHRTRVIGPWQCWSWV